jgi:hypothetical protein
MTYLAPVAPPVPVPSADPAPAPAILAVAEALQPDLAQDFQIDALRLRLEMERAFGGSDADGAWDWKLAYEAGEVALVLFLRKFGRALLARAGSPAALLPILAKVAGLLPKHPALGGDGAVPAILDAAAHEWHRRAGSSACTLSCDGTTLRGGC